MPTRPKKRHRLRKKELRELSRNLESIFSKPIITTAEPVDSAEAGQFEVLLVKGEIIAFIYEGSPFLTVRGLLRYRPTKRYVTVDMGAVKFIYNGADVMAPGITEADEDIAVDDIVWIRDENNFQPLAVGKALMTGREMQQSEKGKAIQTIHHVGDELWDCEG